MGEMVPCDEIRWSSVPVTPAEDLYLESEITGLSHADLLDYTQRLRDELRATRGFFKLMLGVYGDTRLRLLGLQNRYNVIRRDFQEVRQALKNRTAA